MEARLIYIALLVVVGTLGMGWLSGRIVSFVLRRLGASVQIGFVGLLGLDHIRLTLKKGPISTIYIREVRFPLMSAVLFLGNARVPVRVRGIHVTMRQKGEAGVTSSAPTDAQSNKEAGTRATDPKSAFESVRRGVTKRQKDHFEKAWRRARKYLPYLQCTLRDISVSIGGGDLSLTLAGARLDFRAEDWSPPKGTTGVKWPEGSLTVLLATEALNVAVQAPGDRRTEKSASIPLLDISSLSVLATLRAELGGTSAACRTLAVKLGETVVLLSDAAAELLPKSAPKTPGPSRSGSPPPSVRPPLIAGTAPELGPTADERQKAILKQKVASITKRIPGDFSLEVPLLCMQDVGSERLATPSAGTGTPALALGGEVRSLVLRGEGPGGRSREHAVPDPARPQPSLVSASVRCAEVQVTASGALGTAADMLLGPFSSQLTLKDVYRTYETEEASASTLRRQSSTEPSAALGSSLLLRSPSQRMVLPRAPGGRWTLETTVIIEAQGARLRVATESIGALRATLTTLSRRRNKRSLAPAPPPLHAGPDPAHAPPSGSAQPSYSLEANGSMRMGEGGFTLELVPGLSVGSADPGLAPHETGLKLFIAGLGGQILQDLALPRPDRIRLLALQTGAAAVSLSRCAPLPGVSVASVALEVLRWGTFGLEAEPVVSGSQGQEGSLAVRMESTEAAAFLRPCNLDAISDVAGSLFSQILTKQAPVAPLAPVHEDEAAPTGPPEAPVLEEGVSGRLLALGSKAWRRITSTSGTGGGDGGAKSAGHEAPKLAMPPTRSKRPRFASIQLFVSDATVEHEVAVPLPPAWTDRGGEGKGSLLFNNKLVVRDLTVTVGSEQTQLALESLTVVQDIEGSGAVPDKPPTTAFGTDEPVLQRIARELGQNIRRRRKGGAPSAPEASEPPPVLALVGVRVTAAREPKGSALRQIAAVSFESVRGRLSSDQAVMLPAAQAQARLVKHKFRDACGLGAPRASPTAAEAKRGEDVRLKGLTKLNLIMEGRDFAFDVAPHEYDAFTLHAARVSCSDLLDGLLLEDAGVRLGGDPLLAAAKAHVQAPVLRRGMLRGELHARVSWERLTRTVRSHAFERASLGLRGGGFPEDAPVLPDTWLDDAFERLGMPPSVSLTHETAEDDTSAVMCDLIPQAPEMPSPDGPKKLGPRLTSLRVPKPGDVEIDRGASDLLATRRDAPEASTASASPGTSVVPILIAASGASITLEHNANPAVAYARALVSIKALKHFLEDAAALARSAPSPAVGLPDQPTVRRRPALRLDLILRLKGFRTVMRPHPMEAWLAARAPLLRALAVQMDTWDALIEDDYAAALKLAEDMGGGAPVGVGQMGGRKGGKEDVEPLLANLAANTPPKDPIPSTARGRLRRFATAEASVMRESVDSSVKSRDSRFEFAGNNSFRLQVQSATKEGVRSALRARIARDYLHACKSADMPPHLSPPPSTTPCANILALEAEELDLLAVVLPAKGGKLLSEAVDFIKRVDTPSKVYDFQDVKWIHAWCQVRGLTVHVSSGVEPLLCCTEARLAGSIVQARQVAQPPETTVTPIQLGSRLLGSLSLPLKGARPPPKLYTDLKLDMAALGLGYSVAGEGSLAQLAKAVQRINPPGPLSIPLVVDYAGARAYTKPPAPASLPWWDTLRYVWRGGLSAAVDDVALELALGPDAGVSACKERLLLSAESLTVTIMDKKLRLTFERFQAHTLRPESLATLLPTGGWNQFADISTFEIELKSKWGVESGRSASAHHLHLRPSGDEPHPPLNLVELFRARRWDCELHMKMGNSASAARMVQPSSGPNIAVGQVKRHDRYSFTEVRNQSASSATSAPSECFATFILGEEELRFLRRVQKVLSSSPPQQKVVWKLTPFGQPKKGRRIGEKLPGLPALLRNLKMIVDAKPLEISVRTFDDRDPSEDLRWTSDHFQVELAYVQQISTAPFTPQQELLANAIRETERDRRLVEMGLMPVSILSLAEDVPRPQPSLARKKLARPSPLGIPAAGEDADGGLTTSRLVEASIFDQPPILTLPTASPTTISNEAFSAAPTLASVPETEPEPEPLYRIGFCRRFKRASADNAGAVVYVDSVDPFNRYQPSLDSAKLSEGAGADGFPTETPSEAPFRSPHPPGERLRINMFASIEPVLEDFDSPSFDPDATGSIFSPAGRLSTSESRNGLDGRDAALWRSFPAPKVKRSLNNTHVAVQAVSVAASIPREEDPFEEFGARMGAEGTAEDAPSEPPSRREGSASKLATDPPSGRSRILGQMSSREGSARSHAKPRRHLTILHSPLWSLKKTQISENSMTSTEFGGLGSQHRRDTFESMSNPAYLRERTRRALRFVVQDLKLLLTLQARDALWCFYRHTSNGLFPPKFRPDAHRDDQGGAGDARAGGEGRGPAGFPEEALSDDESPAPGKQGGLDALLQDFISGKETQDTGRRPAASRRTPVTASSKSMTLTRPGDLITDFDGLSTPGSRETRDDADVFFSPVGPPPGMTYPQQPASRFSRVKSALTDRARSNRPTGTTLAYNDLLSPREAESPTSSLLSPRFVGTPPSAAAALPPRALSSGPTASADDDDPEAKDGSFLEYDVEIQYPQISFCVDEGLGRMLLSARSGRWTGRATPMRGHVPGFPEKVPLSRNLKLVFDQVAIHSSAGDVDPHAEVAWMRRAAQGLVPHPASKGLMGQVFDPCTMQLDFVRRPAVEGVGAEERRGGASDPLQEMHLQAPELAARLNSREFEVFVGIISTIFLKNTPRTASLHETESVKWASESKMVADKWERLRLLRRRLRDLEAASSTVGSAQGDRTVQAVLKDPMAIDSGLRVVFLKPSDALIFAPAPAPSTRASATNMTAAAAEISVKPVLQKWFACVLQQGPAASLDVIDSLGPTPLSTSTSNDGTVTPIPSTARETGTGLGFRDTPLDVLGYREAALLWLEERIHATHLATLAAWADVEAAKSEARHQRRSKAKHGMRVEFFVKKFTLMLMRGNAVFADAQVEQLLFSRIRHVDESGATKFTVHRITFQDTTKQVPKSPGTQEGVLFGCWNPDASWEKDEMIRVNATMGSPTPEARAIYDHLEFMVHPLGIHLTYPVANSLYDYFFKKNEGDRNKRQEAWETSLGKGSGRFQIPIGSGGSKNGKKKARALLGSIDEKEVSTKKSGIFGVFGGRSSAPTGRLAAAATQSSAPVLTGAPRSHAPASREPSHSVGPGDPAAEGTLAALLGIGARESSAHAHQPSGDWETARAGHVLNMVSISMHAQQQRSVVWARHRNTQSVEAIYVGLEDEFLGPLGSSRSRNGSIAFGAGVQAEANETPEHNVMGRARASAPVKFPASTHATPTKFLPPLSSQNSQLTPSPGGAGANGSNGSPVGHGGRQLSLGPRTPGRSPLQQQGHGRVTRQGSQIVAPIAPLWDPTFDGPSSSSVPAGDAVELLHQRMTTAAYSLIEEPGQLSALAVLVGEGDMVVIAGGGDRARGTGGGAADGSGAAAGWGRGAVTSRAAQKKEGKQKIRFTYVRFNRVYARVSYQGYPMSFNDMKVVLDARVYQVIDCTMRELFQKYLWDAIKSMLRSMARLQGRKFKDILNEDPEISNVPAGLEGSAKDLSAVPAAMSVEVTPVGRRGLLGFLRRNKPPTTTAPSIATISEEESIRSISGRPNASSFVMSEAGSVRGGGGGGGLVGGGSESGGAQDGGPSSGSGGTGLQGLVGEQLDMLKTALKHRQLEAKRRALLG